MLHSSIVDVLACDPGTAVERGPDPGRIEQALAIPVTRAQVVSEMLDSGFDATQSRCIGQGVVTTLPTAELADPEGAFAQTDAFHQTMDHIVDACTGGPDGTARAKAATNA